MIERKTFFPRLTLLVALAVVLSNPLQAGVLALYNAGTPGNPAVAPNPTSLGWTLYDSTLGGPNFSQGAVSPDGTNGYNAWFVLDNTNGSSQFLYYYQNLTPAQESAATYNGATLSCNLRVMNPVAGNLGIQSINLAVGMINGHRFSAFLNVNPAGDLTVNLQGGGSQTVSLTSGGIGATNYHLHQIVYNPLTLSSSYAFDGVTVATNWTGQTTVVDQVQWGAQSSSGMGEAWFNYVQFETGAYPLITPPPPPTFFVATNGNDANAGTIAAPLATLAAAQTKLRSAGVTTNGGIVWIRGGRYSLTSTLSMTAADSGTAMVPALWSAAPGEPVIFDGGIAINPLAFTLETNPTELAKLNSAATNGVVYSQVITNATLIGLLNSNNFLVCNDQFMSVARWPNQGFTYADSINAAPEVKNSLGTVSAPVGAIVHLNGTYNTNAWAAELRRTQTAWLCGYVSADWKRETLRIAGVSAAGLITNMDGTIYGFGSAIVERAYVGRLLCELDQPGEWYFDTQSNKLFLWPPVPLAASTTLKVAAGPQAFSISGANNVQIQRLSLENISGAVNGDGAVSIASGINNQVAGCTFKNIVSPATGVNLTGGTNNGVLSSDFFDVAGGGRLYGGSMNATSVSPAGNYFENCHFMQVYSQIYCLGFGGSVAVNGAGNRFRHNLVHNENTQFLTIYGGVDHLVELNEMFNAGVEDGDGGTIYGDAQIYYFDNFRYNFLHHLILIPEITRRNGIMADDGTCGFNLIGNIFYKASNSFLSNQGSGYTGYGNIFVNDRYGIEFYTTTDSTKYNANMNYLNTAITSTDKANLIGHGMAVFGNTGWNPGCVSNNWINYVSSFWMNRYPTLGVMLTNWWNTKNMHQYGWFTNTVFYGNTGGNTANTTYVTFVGSTNLPNLSAFQDPAVLNFKYSTPVPSYAANIPFEQIGLYVDQFRTSVPNPDGYRGAVAEHWKNTGSDFSGTYAGAGVSGVNARCYFNNGLLLAGMTPPVNSPQALGNDVTPQVVGALPNGMVADSILDWNSATNNYSQPDGAWEYGYYALGATNFTRLNVKALDGDSAGGGIGGNRLTWQLNAGNPQIGQYAMLPGNSTQVVRRWNSTYAGSALVLVDAQQLQASVNNQIVRVYQNGVAVAALALLPATNHLTASVAVTLGVGDQLDLAVDPQGSNVGDWTLASMRVDTQSPVDASRVAWLPMDESAVYPSGIGGLPYDSRLVAADFGNGNHHGVINNMSGKFAWVPGVRGNAIQFEGIDESASLLGSVAGNGATALTISLWINPQAKISPDAGIFSSLGTDFFGIVLSHYGNGMPVEFRAKNQRLTGPDYSGPAGQWTHVVGVWQSGGNQTLYINGVNVGSMAAVSGSISVTNWLLGCDRLLSGRYYSGAIDEVQIYTNALGAAQVMALYTNTLSSYAGFQSPADQNNDGIPDWWQIKYYGFASATNAAPNAIAANGLSNLQDYLSGLTPTNPASILHLSVGSVTPANGGTVVLQWPGVSNYTYSVQWKPSLTTNWTILPGVVPGQSPVTSATIVGNTNNAGFYRIFVNGN